MEQGMMHRTREGSWAGDQPPDQPKKNRNHKPDRIYLKICEHVYIEPIKMICWKYTYVALCAWTHSIEQPQAQNHSTPHYTTHVLCKITTFNIQNLTLHTLLRTPHLHSLSTLHSRLHTSQSTLHTLYWIILPLHTPHFTVQTLDSTLYLSHSTLHT